jgi:hypothetical protein
MKRAIFNRLTACLMPTIGCCTIVASIHASGAVAQAVVPPTTVKLLPAGAGHIAKNARPKPSRPGLDRFAP